MSLTLSARAQVLSQQRSLTPNLILEIEGVPTIYSAIETLELWKIGSAHVIGEPGLVIGGAVAIDDQENLISLSGSGTTITQQLLQDKGAASSVSSVDVELIDKNGLISALVSPGFVLTELLTTKARLYINFEGGLHPQDSVLIHRGIIDEIAPQQGSIKLRLAHPEQLKRQDLFIAAATALNGAIDNAVTTLTVDTTNGFILPSSPYLLSYVKIGDEFIQYTGFNSTQFTGCTRGALGSTAAAHDDNEEVTSFYRLIDNGIDLALKLMLSQSDNLTQNIKYIGATSVDETDENTIFFDNYDIEETLGLVVGDFISITGATNGGNNITLSAITDLGTTASGSYITVNDTLILELSTSAVASFKSQYNVLSEGMGMTPQDVDVARHLDLQTKFSSSIPDYDFYLKDTIKGKEFLSEQIYLPMGFYSVPRKAKASVGVTIPPLAEATAPTLNEDRVVNPSSLKSIRSINKNFYNAVVFRYNEDLNEDKFLSGKIQFSADSQNRIINVGNKPYTVDAKGLRPSDATETLIRINTRRILERYEFASEFLPGVKVLFKDGFPIEVGDIVIFGSPDLKLTDLDEGNRNRQAKLYEVVNKSLNIKTGEVSFDLLGTNFALNLRYGVISPSSYVASGSSTTEIIIIDSFSTASPNIEQDKWSDFIGEKILIHSPDWTYAEETTLTGFDPGNDYKMIVSPALPSPPASGYIIDIPTYADDSTSTNAKYKLMFCHLDPQVLVDTGIDNFSFDVDAGDIDKFFVGGLVRVHSFNYSDDSGDVIIEDITGNTITVDTDMGFTPAAGDEIDLIGFRDEGAPYALI